MNNPHLGKFVLAPWHAVLENSVLNLLKNSFRMLPCANSGWTLLKVYTSPYACKCDPACQYSLWLILFCQKVCILFCRYWLICWLDELDWLNDWLIVMVETCRVGPYKPVSFLCTLFCKKLCFDSLFGVHVAMTLVLHSSKFLNIFRFCRQSVIRLDQSAADFTLWQRFVQSFTELRFGLTPDLNQKVKWLHWNFRWRLEFPLSESRRWKLRSKYRLKLKLSLTNLTRVGQICMEQITLSPLNLTFRFLVRLKSLNFFALSQSQNIEHL